MQYGGTVYILSNEHNNVIYTGVTSDLYTRVKEHKEKVNNKSFTAKYNCCKLVWFQSFSRIEEAIEYEKSIKGGSRLAKLELIRANNADWKDLWNESL